MGKFLSLLINKGVRIGLITLLLVFAIFGVSSSSLAFLPIVGSVDTPGRAWNIDVSGDYVYIADMNKGIQIVNISASEKPVIVATVDLQNSTYDVAISGVYAYAANGTKGLQVINIEDPENPKITGWADTSGHAVGVFISGIYAYVADDHRGLKIVDVSDPENPSIIGFINTKGMAKDVYVSENFAYLADGRGGLKIVDVRDPENPLIISSINTKGMAKSVTVLGNYAYIAEGNNGLEIINISDPENPATVSSVNTPYFAWNVSVSDSFAYVADEKGGLQVINITDSTAPFLVDSAQTPGRPKDTALSGGYAYIADSQKGLQIVDISSLSESHTAPLLASLEIIGTKEVIEHSQMNYTCTAYFENDTEHNVTGSAKWSENCERAHINRNGRLVAQKLSSEDESCTITVQYENKVSSLDITIVNNQRGSEIVGSIPTPTMTMNVFVKDNYAYVTDLMRGLYIIDINNPSEPLISGFVDMKGIAGNFFLSDSTAYIASDSEGVQIVDISDSTAPSQLSTLDTTGKTQAISVSGDYAYIADGSKGVQIADIRDPVKPSLISSLKISGQTVDITVSGTYAYVAAWSKGLQIIDISNPSNPFLVASLDKLGQAQSVVTSGKYAYVATKSKGLQIIDISDPSSPSLISSIDTSGMALDVFVSDTYAFVTNVVKGVQVIDISDPKNPSIVALLDTPGQALSVFVSNTYAFVTDSLNGLQIIDISMLIGPKLLSLEIKGPSEIDEESNGHYRCTALYDDGTDIEVTENFVWSESCSYGEFDKAGYLVASAVDADEPCSISVQYEKVTAAYDIIIKNIPKIQTIKINGSQEVNEQTNEQYTTVVQYDDGTSSDVTSDVLWSEDSSSADITDNGSLSTDEVSDDSPCTISASYADLTQTQDIVVLNVAPKIVSININGPEEVDEQSTAQYNATAYYDDGSNVDITSISTWSENCLYASISDHSLLSIDSVMTDEVCTITASYKENSGNLDITIINIEFFLDSYNTQGNAMGISAFDTYACIADGENGLQIIDVNDPQNPSLVSSFDTLGFASDIFIVDTIAFVADGEIGLQIIDISDLKNPFLVSAVSISHYAKSIYVNDSYAYLTYEIPESGTEIKGGLQIIDISDLENPFSIAFIETVNPALDVFVSGNYAYLVEGNGGLNVIDLNDIQNLTIVSFVDTPGFAGGVFVAGEYAYVADGSSGLQVVSISDPLVPVIVSSVDTPSFAVSVSVSDGYAYVANDEKGLQIIDITIPDMPLNYFSIDTPGNALDVFLLNHFAYIADGLSGLQIIDIPFLSTSEPSLLALGFASGGYIEVLDPSLNFSILGWPRVTWPDYNNSIGEARPVWCNVDSDSKYEMVVGLAQGGNGWLEVKDDVDTNFRKLAWLRINWPEYNASNGETFPACGDLDGDGKDEIAVGFGSGGGGWVQIFDDASTGYAPLSGTPTSGGWVRMNWKNYNTNKSLGEIHPAIANIDSDISEELILGPGPGGQGWIQVLDDSNNGFAHITWLKLDWPQYNNDVGEIRPAACDLNGDKIDEIVVGFGTYTPDGGWVKIFDPANNFKSLKCIYDGWLHVNWPAYNTTNGENFATCSDMDNDGKDELIIGFGYTGGGWYIIFDDCDSGLSKIEWKRSDWADYNKNIGLLRSAQGR